MKNKNELLIKYQNAYYNGAPLVTDLVYDKLYNEVEAENPNSEAILKIGGELINTFETVPHTIPMLSMDKRYSEEEIQEFLNKMDNDIIAEPKIDGISIVLYYKKGKLIRALTRGNGVIGNDVTNNVKTINDVPKVLTRPIDIVVRGEIYLPKKELDVINAQSEIKYANCRNLTAGLMRHKHASKLKDVNLSIFVYEGYYENSPLKHDEILNDLKSLGFKVNDYLHTDKTSLEFDISHFTKIRSSLDYDIDGIVFKVNDIEKRNELGFTKHHPKWAMAYKFESPQAISKLLDIDIQVGRTGRITPVAKIEPTLLQGSTISSVTLHNQDYINMLDLAIGDTIKLSKRGDVIPAIEEVIEKGNNLLYELPKVCPSCGSKLIKNGAHLFCKNENCKDRILNRLSFIVGKNQMDIDGLGFETLKTIYELDNNYNSFLSIFEFDYNQLIDVDGFGKTKIDNIYKGLEKSRSKPLSVVLASFGYEGLGHKSSKLLINHFDKISDILDATEEEISKIKGIGKINSKMIFNIIHDILIPSDFIGDMLKIGLTLFYDKDSNDGKTYCITGTFEMKRSEISELIKSKGDKVVSSVTKNLDFLVCGEKAGSKKAKAEKLGVKIITLKDL